eukprot:1623811-Rhodomonas_salina.1
MAVLLLLMTGMPLLIAAMLTSMAIAAGYLPSITRSESLAPCTETDPDKQTHRHTETQTHGHTDTQDTQTHSRTDIQTHRHTDTQTYRYTDTQKQSHTTDTGTGSLISWLRVLGDEVRGVRGQRAATGGQRPDNVSGQTASRCGQRSSTRRAGTSPRLQAQVPERVGARDLMSCRTCNHVDTFRNGVTAANIVCTGVFATEEILEKLLLQVRRDLSRLGRDRLPA